MGMRDEAGMGGVRREEAAGGLVDLARVLKSALVYSSSSSEA